MGCKESAKQNVLFVCTGNACRSQMAEGFLRTMAPERFNSFSAGMVPGNEIHPMAIRVMDEVGIDLSKQYPKSVKEYLGVQPIYRLIIVCRQANRLCPHVWPLLAPDARLYWPFNDPAAAQGSEAARLQMFRRIRDEIRCQIDLWLMESSK